MDFKTNFDLNKTINELDGVPIPRPNSFESNLVKRCYDLANKKLKLFSVGDLRIMIGQNLGLEYLIPMALQVLENDAFIEGDFFEGDLLLNVMRIDNLYWKSNPNYKRKLLEIYRSNLNSLEKVDNITQKELFEEYETLTE
jgi:hypothetical protein